MSAKLRFSIELFPPRDAAGTASFLDTVRRLAVLGPDFCSVTYGAGGSNRAGSEAALRGLQDLGLAPAAAHLTCAGQSRREVIGMARRWHSLGISRIVALRGDAPGNKDGFPGAAELVSALSASEDFDISVACYPECHPKSEGSAADLDYLRRKLDAGASRALSQFFFDPAVFLRFRDAASRAGIRAPLIPGILPIHDLARVSVLAERCGASIPARVRDRLSALDQDPEAHGQVAVSLAVGLCEALIREGVDRFHFYTLNRPTMTLAVCRAIGIQPAIRLAA